MKTQGEYIIMAWRKFSAMQMFFSEFDTKYKKRYHYLVDPTESAPVWLSGITLASLSTPALTNH